MSILNRFASIISSSKTTILLVVVSLIVGFYLGWHLNNEKHIAGVLDSIEDVRKIESNNIQSSIISSEETYKKINAEIDRANNLLRVYKKESETDVLDLQLPDATLGVLRSASGR